MKKQIHSPLAWMRQMLRAMWKRKYRRERKRFAGRLTKSDRWTATAESTRPLARWLLLNEARPLRALNSLLAESMYWTAWQSSLSRAIVTFWKPNDSSELWSVDSGWSTHSWWLCIWRFTLIDCLMSGVGSFWPKTCLEWFAPDKLTRCCCCSCCCCCCWLLLLLLTLLLLIRWAEVMRSLERGDWAREDTFGADGVDGVVREKLLSKWLPVLMVILLPAGGGGGGGGRGGDWQLTLSWNWCRWCE